jgi:hypothetical protein
LKVSRLRLHHLFYLLLGKSKTRKSRKSQGKDLAHISYSTHRITTERRGDNDNVFGYLENSEFIRLEMGGKELFRDQGLEGEGRAGEFSVSEAGGGGGGGRDVPKISIFGLTALVQALRRTKPDGER